MLGLNSLAVVTTTSGLRLRRRGFADLPVLSGADSAFTMDVTIPTLANTGPDLAALGRALTPYAGPNAGGTVTITGAFGALTYVGVDFGATRIKRGTDALAVRFVDCAWTATWTSTASSPVSCVDMRFSPNAAEWVFERCSFINAAQAGYANVGIYGENFRAIRCQARNFQDLVNVYVDSSRVDMPIRIELAGCWLGDAALYWHPDLGVVHPSDRVAHPDLVQMQGGRGMAIHGCMLAAYLSPTIGVGTPRSGSEYVTGVPYTQAEGEAKRAELIAAGHRPVALMINIARGNVPAIDFHHNWGGGGGFWLNAAGPFGTDATLTYNFGAVHHNVVKRDQYWVVNGSPVAFGIDDTGVVNYHSNFWANDDWTPSTNAIPRHIT